MKGERNRSTKGKHQPGASRESEDEYRSLIANFLDVVYVVEPDGTIVFVSPQIARYGYQPEEVQSHNFIEFVAPDCREYVLRKFGESLASGESFPTALKWLRKDGKTTWVETLGKTLYDDSGRPTLQVEVARDIASRKDAEDALLASRSMLQLVMDNIPQGIFWKDTSSVYQGCNAVFAESVGVGSPEKIRGKTDYDISYTEEQADWFRKFDRQVMATGKPVYHIIEPFRDASGREGWADTNKIPLRDTEGNVVGVLGTYQDITERMRTEEALRDREALLNSIFRAAPIGIGLVSNRIIREANAELCHMLGYDREEIVGRDARLIYPTQEDYDYVGREKYRQIREKGTGTVETRWQRKDGRVIDVLLSSTPIDPDRSLADTTFTALDISERKHAEAMLRESETKFKTLFEDAGVAIFIADAETGAIADCNSTAEELIGRPRAELIGMLQVQLHPPDLAEQVRKEFQHYAMLGRRANYETEVLHKDGRRIPIILNSCLLSINGKNMMIGFFLDNTERKRAEKGLSEAKARAELYVDLMGHDINNMHQIALGYLEIARETLRVEEGQIELLDKPIEVLQRSARLISNVRKLQQLQEVQSQARAIDVCGTLADVRQEYGAVPGKTIKLDLRCKKPCSVLANDLLHDVFSNLVGNAIKHTRDPAEIEVILDRVEDAGHRYCRVTVEDNGCGIHDDYKDIVFARLVRGTDKAKGIGLGLYLVKSLVESYSGKVWVEDRVPGDHTKGARFVVQLPEVDRDGSP